MVGIPSKSGPLEYTQTTLNHLFMKETLPYLYFGVPGVCSRGLFEFSLSYVSPFDELSLAQMFKLQLLGFGGNGHCY